MADAADQTVRKDRSEFVWPGVLAAVVFGASYYITNRLPVATDSFKQLASSSTVIGTVLFGFLSATLGIFLSNDKNDVIVKFRKSDIHRRRMMFFFKEAMFSAFILVLVSVFFGAFGEFMLRWWPQIASFWFGSMAWLLACVARVYRLVFSMFD